MRIMEKGKRKALKEKINLNYPITEGPCVKSPGNFQ